ncbi:MAG TPA: hypothetical protein VFK52_00530 [Nocardioidaceae bacterium]|nr:hypothetical protein [Nocardioidaceae bacterium]
MPTTDGSLTTEHRQRLLDVGVDPDVLAGLRLRTSTDGLSDTWTERGNALYLADGFRLPDVVAAKLDAYDPYDALVVVCTGLTEDFLLLVAEERATLFLGPDTFLPMGSVYVGRDSVVVLNGGVSGTRAVEIDARNGGSVVVDQDQLWAHNVYIATDDMHRLEDLATGVRLNPYGAHIKLGRHVWLGRDAVLTGHVDIGDGCVVGLGSFVRGQKIPPNTAVAGSPARVVREGVRWTLEDTP